MYSILENFWNDDKMKLMTMIDGNDDVVSSFEREKKATIKSEGKEF
jgi:hypothetical protein